MLKGKRVYRSKGKKNVILLFRYLPVALFVDGFQAILIPFLWIKLRIKRQKKLKEIVKL